MGHLLVESGPVTFQLSAVSVAVFPQRLSLLRIIIHLYQKGSPHVSAESSCGLPSYGDLASSNTVLGLG